MYDLTIYTDEELKKIQKLELGCLKAIIDVCQKIGVEYFLIGGSALGAVRHGGFIPWDDDIDIGMTRKNYSKFIDMAPQYLPENYHLQSPYSSDNNPYYYSKIRIDGTQFVEYCNRKVNMHQGVYVDIFPFDEVPNNDDENRIQFETFQKLIRKFSLRQSPDVSSEPKSVEEKARSVFRKFLHRLYRLKNYEKLLNDLNNTVTKYNGTGQEAIACLNFPNRKKEYIKKTDLYPLKDIFFEDITVKIPNNYDIYLRTHYDDYMKLPPENQRYGHKPYKIYLG